MARVIWSTKALSDVRAAAEYIAKDSPTAAVRFLDKILDSADRIEKSPLGGSVVFEWQMENVREILFGSYRVIYAVSGDVCHITTVIHASRDLVQHIDPEVWHDF